MFKFLKQHKWIFITSLLGYGLWVLFWLIKANIIFTDSELLSLLLPSRQSPSDFTVSHAASALDSLIFFITVSLVITMLSIKKPEEEKLDRKIEYIFEGADSKSKLGQYLAKEITSLACISALTERMITFNEFNPQENAMKVLSHADVQIKNIHNNHLYANDEMTYRIKADDVKAPNGVFGEVHDISMIFDANQPDKNTRVLEGSETIRSASEVFERCFSLELKPQEQVIYRTNAWIWQSLQAPLRIMTPRFIEKQIIKLKNQSDVTLTVDAKLPGKKDSKEEITHETYKLDPKQTITIELYDTTPNDIIIFDFEVSPS